MAENNQKFSFRRRWHSFSYAFNGLKLLFLFEHNSRIHLAAAVIVFLLGWAYEISKLEWIAVIFCVGFVFFAEIINTSVEKIVNFISPEYHKRAGEIKDLSAAAVLISAVTAIAVGLIILIPKI